MSDPVAYFLTWHTYGTWLPGDDRGWLKKGRGHREADPDIKDNSSRLMKESGFILTVHQRTIVEQTIAKHCQIRGWSLHAMNCRSNHVHVVLTARVAPDDVVRQLKAWCTRRLKENDVKNDRKQWWVEGASKRFINDTDSLELAVDYVERCQD